MVNQQLHEYIKSTLEQGHHHTKLREHLLKYGYDEDTIKEAERLWQSVNRPNLMIKIPGTRAGLPAIRQSIANGINVNVTLIFSVYILSSSNSGRRSFHHRTIPSASNRDRKSCLLQSFFPDSSFCRKLFRPRYIPSVSSRGHKSCHPGFFP